MCLISKAMFDFLKNRTVFADKYHTHGEAVVIACYFNPFRSPHRKRAFDEFYFRIKHLPHRILECLIADSEPELPETESISHVRTENLLWHKETLLNKIIAELPKKFRFVFWSDADLIFTNPRWLTESVAVLRKENIVQPFEYAVHLDKGEIEPSFDTSKAFSVSNPNAINSKVWRSFAANYASDTHWQSEDYNTHGHVGFVWGARREILEKIPLYDHALIGGGDHIIAHAAAGQILHHCIAKSFKSNLVEIEAWSKAFYGEVQGKIGFTKGAVYHLWHGDLKKRQYHKRVLEFSEINKNITQRDENGFFISDKPEAEGYLLNYFSYREEGQA